MEIQRVGIVNVACMFRQVSRVGIILGFGKEFFSRKNVLSGAVFPNDFTLVSHSVQIGITTQLIFSHSLKFGFTTQYLLYFKHFWG